MKNKKQENTNKLSNNTTVYSSFMFYVFFVSYVVLESNRLKQKPENGNHEFMFSAVNLLVISKKL